jgi:hypothetical protein
MRVTDAEVNPRQHDAFLDVIVTHSQPVSEAMHSMGVAAGRAARSSTPSDFAVAVYSMQRAGEHAAAFLNALAGSQCPAYLRGADSAVQDALKLLVDGGRRGVQAARAADVDRLTEAAKEMEVANQDFVAAAQRITIWRSGAARP